LVKVTPVADGSINVNPDRWPEIAGKAEARTWRSAPDTARTPATARIPTTHTRRIRWAVSKVLERSMGMAGDAKSVRGA
jgi:hypothetical protein